MKTKNALFALLVIVLPTAITAQELPPIQKVELQGRTFMVNGKPFFPIMAWLQAATNFPLLKECGMNSTAGYWAGSGQKKDVTGFLNQIGKAGLYGVVPFDEGAKGHRALLGYIHDDEPDLSHPVSDAVVEPGKTLQLNPKTPLWKIVDGDLNSWSVLDPLEGASFTIRLQKPVTIEALGVALTVSKGLSLPKEMAFEANGQQLLKAALTEKKGLQKFSLPQAATFQELTVKVLGVTPGEQVYGSLGEIEGLDKEGKNVLLAPPRQVPRAMPDETLRKYAAIKAADPARPVFMTLTGRFHPIFKNWPEQERLRLYPEYVKAADVVGYDIYPIYGWNKPEWLYLVHEATEQLVSMAEPRPVYAWIETSKGGQWTGALESQKEVTPEHIRAEVWMCICRGATAMGYFTHIWKPQYSQFGVPENNRRALREINHQITKLAPAILGQPFPQAVSVKASGNTMLDIMARRLGQDLYLFAVNYDQGARPTKAAISVPGLAAGTKIEVVDEARSLQADPGSFVDEFAPLAIHIYRLTASN